MPREGVEWKSHETMLSFEEILRIAGIMAGLGIRKIRVTGGEPLVRRGLASFLEKLKALPGIEKITLTTNGLLLGAYLEEAENRPGSLPDGINISLDALDPLRLERITRRENLNPAEILSLADRLIEKRVPVKLNCVPVRSYNEEEILPLAALAKTRNMAVRFIELMPMGQASALEPVPGAEIASMLEKAYGPLAPVSAAQAEFSLQAEFSPQTAESGSGGPAVYYSLPGFTGIIGFINPVSCGFCESCNRLRLTSDGILKPCLSHNLGLDLRELCRSGSSDEEIARAIAGIAAQKPGTHNLSGIYGAAGTHNRDGMFRIGG